MKRKLLILSLLVILAALTAAGTLAYYTDSARTHNVITSGKVNIDLLEWANEEHTKPFKDKQGVMPGTKVTKIVEVKNTGTGAAFVRLRVETEVRSAEKQEMDPKHVRLDFNQTDWIYQDGYYYYARSLQPGETTVPLFTAPIRKYGVMTRLAKNMHTTIVSVPMPMATAAIFFVLCFR